MPGRRLRNDPPISDPGRHPARLRNHHRRAPHHLQRRRHLHQRRHHLRPRIGPHPLSYTDLDLQRRRPVSPLNPSLKHANPPRTFPTTYVAYTDFSHITVASAPTCATASTDLTLGAPTNWASLVYPTAQFPAGGLLPQALVGYLDSLPAVAAELGGTIVSNCDPQQGGTLPPAAAPTATATVASSVGGVVRRTVPTTTNVPAAAAANQGPAPPPPPPPPPPPAQSGAVNPFSPAGTTGSVTANAVTPATATYAGPVLQTTNAAARPGDGDAWLVRTLLPGLCGVFVFFV